MLKYDRIDISEVIDINQATDSHECKVYHYWYFFKKVLLISILYATVVMTWHKNLWALKLLQLLLLENIVLGSNFWGMTKIGAMNRIKNADLSKKKADSYKYEKNFFYSNVKKHARDYD